MLVVDLCDASGYKSAQKHFLLCRYSRSSSSGARPPTPGSHIFIFRNSMLLSLIELLVSLWDFIAFMGCCAVGPSAHYMFVAALLLLWWTLPCPWLTVSDVVGRLRLGEREFADTVAVKGRSRRPRHSNSGCCACGTW